MYSVVLIMKSETASPENLQKNKSKLGTWGVIMQHTHSKTVKTVSSEETITWPQGQPHLDPPLPPATPYLTLCWYV